MFDESPNFILIFGTGFLFHFLLYRFLERFMSVRKFFILEFVRRLCDILLRLDDRNEVR